MRIIDARAKYLDNRPFVLLTDLETYAENTYSTLLYLTLQSLPVASMTLDHVASHIGKASGIAAVLRGLPLIAFPPPPNQHFNSQNLSPGVQDMRKGSQTGSVVLPLDVMAECGVRDEDVLRHGAEANGLKDAVFNVATRGSDHLITARTMLRNIKEGEDVGHAFEYEGEAGHDYSDVGRGRGEKNQSEEMKNAFGIFLPAVSTDLWLRRLEKADFNIFDESLRRREWRLPWKAWLAWKRTTF